MSEVTSEILKAVVIALVPAAFGLVAWIASHLKAWIEANVKNALLKRIANEALEVVGAVSQSISEPAKEAAKDGKLTDDEKARIKALAVDALMKRLKDIPAHILPDLAARASDAIEAAVKATKNPPQAQPSK
jgi:hypothetical protein